MLIIIVYMRSDTNLPTFATRIVLVVFLFLFTVSSILAAGSYFVKRRTETVLHLQKGSENTNVLGESDTANNTIDRISFYVPAVFHKNVTFKNGFVVEGDLGARNATLSGNLTASSITASNVIYSVTAGGGISVTTGQTPVITNTGVLSIAGQTGAIAAGDGINADNGALSLDLTAGGGISIDGSTISNNDRGTAQNIFKTFSVSGQTDITAGSNTDKLTFVAGNNVTLSTDADNKKLTITASAPATTDSGWSVSGGNVVLTTISNNVGIGTASPTEKLEIAGNIKINGGLSMLGQLSADPVTAANGSMYYNTTQDRYRCYEGGTWKYCDTSVSGSLSGTGTTNTVPRFTSINTIGNSAIVDNGTTVVIGTALTFSETTPTLSITNTGTFTLNDGTNPLLTVADNGTTGTLTVDTLAATNIGAHTLTGNVTGSGSPSITGLGALSAGGTITFGGLNSTGIVHTNGSGVLSTSALNLAGGASEVTGTLPTTNGGTGINSYTTGDIIYSSSANTLSKLAIGSTNQILAVSGGIPVWTSLTGGGGICPDCLITDPTSTATNTISPTGNGTIGLTVKQTSGTAGDIFRVQDNSGSTTYFKVDSTGNTVTTGTINGLTLASNADGFSITGGTTPRTFSTTGSNITLTGTGATNVTLPTTGTLLTNTTTANQTITTTQTIGTAFGISDSTNLSGNIIGQAITLSGTGAFDQTGLKFNLSGASGSNLNDLIGSGDTWKISTVGDASFNSITVNSINGGAITSSGNFRAANGTNSSPSYSFSNSTAVGLYLPGTNQLGIATSGTDRMRIDANGNVGIGTTTPLSLLQVEGSVAGKALVALNYTGTDQNILVASSSGSTKFVVDRNGTITTGIWNGTTIGTLFGGTGITSYAPGDTLYASSANTLSKLGIGTSGQFLTVSNGMPTWTTLSAGLTCPDCVLNDPTATSTNTITPGSGVVPLILRASSDGTSDIFKIQNNNGSSTYFNVDNAGVITAGTWQGSTIGQAYGGTGFSTYTQGDILYASSANTLSKLPIGSSTQVLTVNGSGVPSWGSVTGGSGGLCTNCLITDPSSSTTNLISPTGNGTTALTLRQTSGTAGNIFRVQNNAGSTTYLNIDSNGDTTFNGVVNFANGSTYKVDNSGNATFLTVNGNTITNGTGTLTLGAGKTLTANSSLTLAGTDSKTLTVNNSLTLGGTDGKSLSVTGNTTLAANSLTFEGTESLTLAAAKNVSFGDSFSTVGANALTLTTTGSTNVTLPTTGTLLTNTESANQTITSTQTSGTLFSLADSTNIGSAIKGLTIDLSGTGAFDQTGLQFNLSGASGSNLNDVIGSGSTWKISTTGAATFSSISTTSLTASGLTPGSVVFAGSGGILSQDTPNFYFDSSTHNLGIGNSSPTEKLSVTGNATISGNLTLGNGSAIQSAYGPLTLKYKSAANTWATAMTVQDTTGNIGIGTTSPTVGLDLVISANSSALRVLGNNQTVGGLYFDASGSSSFISSGAQKVNGVWTERTISGGGTGTNSILGLDAGMLKFYTNTGLTNGNSFTPSERMRIDTAGNVGIGTSAPTTRLTVQQSADAVNYASQEGLVIQSPTTTTRRLQFYVNGGGNPYAAIQSVNNGIAWQDLFIQPQGTGNTIFNLAGGNIGIGTTNPGSNIHLTSTSQNTYLTLQNANTFGGKLEYISSTTSNTGDTGELKITAGVNGQSKITLTGGGDAEETTITFADGSTSWILGCSINNVCTSRWGLKRGTAQLFNIDSSGNFGIGQSSSSPVGRFNVDGSGMTSIGKALVILNQSESQDIFTASSSGTTRFVIDNAGNVGIGTNAPTSTLDVRGNVAVGSNGGIRMLSLGSADGNPSFIAWNGDTNLINIGAYSTSKIMTIKASGGLNFTTGNSAGNTLQRMTVDSNGNVGIGLSTSPEGKFVISSSGQTAIGKALAIFDQYENQDIFTASSSGVTKFTINSSGNVGIGNSSPLFPLDIVQPAGGRFFFGGTSLAGGTGGSALQASRFSRTGYEMRFGETIGNDAVIGGNASDAYFGALQGNRQVDIANMASSPNAPIIIAGNPGGGTPGSSYYVDIQQALKNSTTNNTGALYVNDSFKVSNTGVTALGKAAGIFDQYESQDILTASASGTTKFIIANNGDLKFAGASSFLNTLTSASSANRTFTLPDADGTICITSTCGAGVTGTVNSGVRGYFGYYPSSGNTIDDQSFLYTDGTNIGIGTTAPSSAFQVYSFGINSSSQIVPGANAGLNDVSTGTFRLSTLLTANHNQTLTLQSSSRQLTLTSGTLNGITTDMQIIPSSGNMTANIYNMAPLVNQTGGANGITRGLYINPTLTSAADWRSLELANNSGYAIYQSGSSAKSYFAGNIGIGTTSPTTALVVNGSTILGGTTQAANSTEVTVTGNLSISQYIRNSGGANVLQIGSGSYPTFNFGLITPEVRGYSNQDLIYNTGAAAYSHLFKLNGTEVMRINTGGNIGIGTTAPGARFNINNSALTAIGKSLSIFDQYESQDIFTASASGTTKFVIANNGNIQFTGSTSGLNVLTSAATSARTYTFPDATGTVCLSTGNCGGGSGTVNSGIGGYFSYYPATGTTLDDQTALYTNGTNIGIGTTAPGTKLAIHNTTTTTLTDYTQAVAGNGLVLEGTYTNNGYLPGLVWATSDNNPTKPKAGIWAFEDTNGSAIQFGTSNNYGTGITNTALTIDYSGNVGIGITAPQYSFDVSGVANIRGDGVSGHGLYVSSSGNVGINNINPTSPFHIKYDNGANSTVLLESANDSALMTLLTDQASGDYAAVLLRRTSESGDGWNFGMGPVDNNFYLTSRVSGVNTEKFVFDTNGNLGINTNAAGTKLFVSQSQQTLDSNIKNSVANNAIDIVSTYGSGGYLPGLTWSLSDASPTKPVAGIYSGVDTNGSSLYFGTSNLFASGITQTAMSINSRGYIGIGSSSPNSVFSVTNSSFSAAGRALGIFDQYENQDILTASASGTTVMKLDRNGAMTLGNASSKTGALTLAHASNAFTTTFQNSASQTQNNTFTLPVDDGTSGQVLQTDGSGILSWSTPSGGTNYWQLNSGVISPSSLSTDLNLGATATSSAKISLAGSLTRGKALGIFNQTENQDIFTASASGTTRFTIANNGSITQSPTNTTGTAYDLTSSTVTSGKLLQLSTGAANTWTSGNLLDINSTSTALTTGRLASLDWSPTSATTATGDLFSLNIGSNGNANSLFNIKDSGSSIFSVSETALTTSLPASFNAAGDTSFAYDLQFTNQTATSLKSNAPLTLDIGESWESNNLTLRTYNSGNIILDTGATAGKVSIGSSITPTGLLTVDNTNTSTMGKALAIFNQDEAQDIISASASGTTKFVVNKTGQVTTNDGVVEKVHAGACSDSDFSTTNNGLTCIDSSNGRYYFRYGGAWHYVAQTAGFQIPNYEAYSYDFGKSSFDTSKALSSGDFLMPFVENSMSDGAVHGLYTKFSDVRNQLLAPSLDPINFKLSNSNSAIATIAAQLAKLETTSDVASVSGRLDVFDLRVSSVEDKVAQLTTQIQNLEAQILGASSSANLASASATLAENKLDLSDLTVTGKTNLYDLGVSGTFTSGLLTINGFDDSSATTSATISTLAGPLRLQANAMNDLDIMNGKVLINTDGNITTSGSITASVVNTAKLNINVADTLQSPLPASASASIGEAVLKAGQLSVTINTGSVTAKSFIFVTPKSDISSPLTVSSQVAGTSFTVKINAAQATDVKFNWWIVN